VCGFAWVTILHYWMNLSFSSTLMLANSLPVLYSVVFFVYLSDSQKNYDGIDETQLIPSETVVVEEEGRYMPNFSKSERTKHVAMHDKYEIHYPEDREALIPSEACSLQENESDLDVMKMPFWQRTELLLSLWPVSKVNALQAFDDSLKGSSNSASREETSQFSPVEPHFFISTVYDSTVRSLCCRICVAKRYMDRYRLSR